MTRRRGNVRVGNVIENKEVCVRASLSRIILALFFQENLNVNDDFVPGSCHTNVTLHPHSHPPHPLCPSDLLPNTNIFLTLSCLRFNLQHKICLCLAENKNLAGTENLFFQTWNQTHAGFMFDFQKNVIRLRLALILANTNIKGGERRAKGVSIPAWLDCRTLHPLEDHTKKTCPRY